MKEQILKIFQAAKTDIASAKEADLQLISAKYIGRKSELADMLKKVGNLDREKRKLAGKLLNQVKNQIQKLIDSRKADLLTEKQTQAKRDTSLPGIRPTTGHLSPLTLVERELVGIFRELGFTVVTGPEAEWEKYNFDMLNIPANHPARDEWDTFWLKENTSGGKLFSWMKPGVSKNTLLRTHTSPVQIRYMLDNKPPLRIISPGKVFRYEAEDATHAAVFNQLEGLMVDKNINVAHLKAVMLHFVRRVLGDEHNIRLRPSFFPFTEPSFEVDVSCGLCKGEGCRSCHGSGWLELMGAGMVHPQVLRNVGIDPNEYSGFAFGAGIERLAMLKYGITDIRLFLGGDTRFTNQF
ncbi:MAG: phenylalanine--tRNA ligase subunit alpha [Patescibacteria group bacterium]|nr:phenylalanine--tRNA ligase subunit alpha [Patescibacteria group bacterium]